jgi:hypothetical protein
MAKKDLTAEEWVENHMKIQEEDIEFLTNLI